MPLKLSTGFTKKIGQPHYGSLGASCSAEIELDQAILIDDLEGVYQKTEELFAVCRHAVAAELARHDSAPDGDRDDLPLENGDGRHNHLASQNVHRRSLRDWTRKATPNQIRALEAIARRHSIELAGLVYERYSVEELNELTIPEASGLIQELQALAKPDEGPSA